MAARNKGRQGEKEKNQQVNFSCLCLTSTHLMWAKKGKRKPPTQPNSSTSSLWSTPGGFNPHLPEEERTTGVPSTAGNLAVITGRYRRILSCTFVRALETCLLDRLGHMDAGAREAALRRQTTVKEEERDRQEASAYFQAYVRGRGGRLLP